VNRTFVAVGVNWNIEAALVNWIAESAVNWTTAAVEINLMTVVENEQYKAVAAVAN